MDLKETFITNLVTYAKIDTGGDSSSNTVPTTQCQFDLAYFLRDQLISLGLKPEIDEHCFLYCLMNEGSQKRICLNAHLDTAEDAPNKNVKPRIHQYEGKDISLENNITLLATDLETQNVQKGDTIVSSDGTTLLGGDDKAGISIIMTLIQYLLEDKTRLAGLPEIMVCFSPDEENGKGGPYFNLQKLRKNDQTIALTIDGSNHHKICLKSIGARNFNVEVTGYSTHPGYAYHKLINAATAASDIISELKKQLKSAEESKDEEGYLLVRNIKADISQASFNGFIRGYTDEQLDYFSNGLRRICKEHKGAAKVTVEIVKAYENLEKYIPEDFKNKLRKHGEKYNCKYNPARGGTDGAKLSVLGLPTPDLWYGGHAYHSVREVVNVSESIDCIKFLIDFIGDL
ncbi:Peptidase T [Spironucleus salmonicida]|uniref:Peptidase T n=1 Tax=Spironucleus salmonicida TaxID=348837 RepID=V6LPA6_9EUKA|nr:Peptidase T [Spironucleus salmonicida]|eukprot:EST46440.1 Peptidase T [Spironucleus salmonicida]